MNAFVREALNTVTVVALIASGGLAGGLAYAHALTDGSTAAVSVDRTHSPMLSPRYRLTADAADEVAPGVFDALVDAGNIGAVNDGGETIYPPIGTVVELGHGTATVTVAGVAICEDGASQRCSGSEYLTDGWLGA